MRSFAPLFACLALSIPFLAAASGATACDGPGSGLPVVVAHGVLESGDADAHPVDDVGGASITVWPLKAPDSHGDLRWTLRDRATGAEFDSGGAIEVPFPRFSGVSPYEDLCLEVDSDQNLPTAYVIVVTATPDA